MQEKVYKKWIKDIDELRARILISALLVLIKQTDSGSHVFVHALKLH